MTASELETKRSEAESTTAKVEDFTQRLAKERHVLGQVEHELAERLSLGEEAAELIAHAQRLEGSIRGLELALHRVRQQQDAAHVALSDATKQVEAARYSRALERLKKDAQRVDEALNALEQSCDQAAESILAIQQLKAGHEQNFLVVCRLELERFTDMAISPLTGTPKPPSRMMRFSKWSESIPAAGESQPASMTGK